ncbi:MAG TPA: anti-sigma factor [Pseudonocardia sp.]|nr:anti-sigma factor [Pseudonocardia sp.]
MTDRHVAGDLGVYLAGAMEPRDAWGVESHLAVCGWCSTELRELRDVTALLEGMPPEALLDGPPDGGDLLLRRTVRQVRREAGRGRRVAGVAAAVLVGAAGLGGGFWYGQQSAPQPPPAVVAAPDPVPFTQGALTGQAVDPETGAEMAVTVLPTAGWVRLSATTAGIPPGERCRMVVVAEDGTREVAFSWLTGEPGAGTGPLSGSALVAPEDVAAVEVETEDGRTFVSVPL